jgi:hypothetical protein
VVRQFDVAGGAHRQESLIIDRGAETATITALPAGAHVVGPPFGLVDGGFVLLRDPLGLVFVDEAGAITDVLDLGAEPDTSVALGAHLITPDGVEHDHGPYTPPAFEAVAASDRRIRQIWEVLNRPPLAGKSTLFVVSDHGFAPYEKRVHPNVLLRRKGLLDVDSEGKVTARRAWCVAQGGCTFVYVLGENDHRERVDGLRAELAAMEGVQLIIDPAQYAQLDVALPEENPQAPNFILTSAPGYSFTDTIEGEMVTDAGGLRGSHGHLPQPEYMHAMFVAAGAGIQPAAKLEIIRNIDVAPTAAKLMGVELPTATGRVLDEALKDD